MLNCAAAAPRHASYRAFRFAYMVVTASRMAVIDEQTAALEAAMRSESTWYCDIACSFASCSL